MIERIRIMDAATVLTVMERMPPEAFHPWGLTGCMSRAQYGYIQRRAEQLAGQDYQSRTAIHRRDDGALEGKHDSRHIEVIMIGDQPFYDALRDHPELRRLPLRDIPGFRLVYAFPGLTVRAERLWPKLDQLAQAGVREIQLDHLRGLI